MNVQCVILTIVLTASANCFAMEVQKTDMQKVMENTASLGIEVGRRIVELEDKHQALKQGIKNDENQEVQRANTEVKAVNQEIVSMQSLLHIYEKQVGMSFTQLKNKHTDKELRELLGDDFDLLQKWSMADRFSGDS